MSPEKQALSAFWSHKRFWLLQTLALAIWTALALSWFWLPDSHVWGVALAAVQGVVVLAAGLWLLAELRGPALLIFVCIASAYP